MRRLRVHLGQREHLGRCLTFDRRISLFFVEAGASCLIQNVHFAIFCSGDEGEIPPVHLFPSGGEATLGHGRENAIVFEARMSL